MWCRARSTACGVHTPEDFVVLEKRKDRESGEASHEKEIGNVIQLITGSRAEVRPSAGGGKSVCALPGTPSAPRQRKNRAGRRRSALATV